MTGMILNKKRLDKKNLDEKKLNTEKITKLNLNREESKYE